MRLTAKCDYATRAVWELARAHEGGRTLKAEELATQQGIPSTYLVQILLELKGHGIVRSQRGKEGGYCLARPPAEITFGEVLRALHGHVFDPPAVQNSECPPELRAAWQQLKEATETAADSLDYQTLLNRAQERSRTDDR